MKFRRIFGRYQDIQLYSVFVPGEKPKGKRADSFSKVFNNWNDTQYLLQVLLENESALNGSEYRNLSIDDILDEILVEAAGFELQLRKIENREAGYENIVLTDLFKPLFKKIYVLQPEHLFPENEMNGFSGTKLRLYALKLKKHFITGRLNKILNQTENELDEDVKWKLNEVCHFFKKELVFDPWGLEENKF